MLTTQADAHADLAEVWPSQVARDACRRLSEALARDERKENLVMAERTRARELAELQALRAL